MGFLANFKGQQALTLHSKGNIEAAKAKYAEALKAGMDQPRLLLAYSVLLIRTGEYEAASKLLVETQKAPGITPDQKSQLFMNYAVCAYKLGNLEKGISLLEKQHLHQPSGIIYQTLGYLYIEKYLPENRPADDDGTWAEGLAKAQAYLEEAVDYDDEDPICLDNLAQFHYRVLGDKAAAKPYFDKAHKVKEGQIDTLWFLSRYDVESGDIEAALEKLEDAVEGRFSPLNYVTKEQVETEIARLKSN